MRLPVKPEALVEAWFDMLGDDTQRALARELRHAVLAAEPQLAQTVKWGNLVFTLSGASAAGGMARSAKGAPTSLLAICVHKSHATLQIFNGAALAAQWPRLEGTGRGVRHLKCRYGQPVDAALIGALVRDSVDEASA